MTKEEIEALKNRSFQQNEDDKYENAMRLCDHLNIWFGTKATKHKKTYKLFRNLAILFVTLSSVVSILDVAFGLKILSYGGAVISVIATTFTSLLTATNAQKDWINSRNASQKFQIEKFHFLQRSGVYRNLKKNDAVTLFSENLADIWDLYHGNWSEIKSE